MDQRPHAVRRYLACLTPGDAVTILFMNLLSLVAVFFWSRIPQWWIIVLINAVVSLAIVVMAERSGRDGGLLRLFHHWYVVLIILFVFKEIYFMNRAIHLGRDYDPLLIAIDHAMFGVNPTQWIDRFATPVLTEILQLAYASYYFLMIFLGYELYREGRSREFAYSVFCIFYGFYLSYLGYLLLPSVGPRFTLHDFQTMNSDLPGLWLTPLIRDAINFGESVPLHAANAVEFVQRDVFPSGHTQMTLITIFLALKYRIRFRSVVTVIGTLLIISTVYLRYHYVVDLIAGALFMMFTIWTAPKLFSVWNSVREKLS